MSKTLTLSLWMAGSRIRIERHEAEVSQAYDKLKALHTEMANQFALIDLHSGQIAMEEQKLKEHKQKWDAIKQEQSKKQD